VPQAWHPPRGGNDDVGHEQPDSVSLEQCSAGRHAFKGGSKSGGGGADSYLFGFPDLLAIEIDYNQVRVTAEQPVLLRKLLLMMHPVGARLQMLQLGTETSRS